MHLRIKEDKQLQASVFLVNFRVILNLEMSKPNVTDLKIDITLGTQMNDDTINNVDDISPCVSIFTPLTPFTPVTPMTTVCLNNVLYMYI